MLIIKKLKTYALRPWVRMLGGLYKKSALSLFAAIGFALFLTTTPYNARAEDDTTTHIAGTSESASSYYAGKTGSNNDLYIYNTGRLKSRIGYIGYGNSANSNLALVWGAGSRWENSRRLYVGYRGSENLLYIGSGGSVSDNHGYIGFKASANQNGVYATGAGSLWKNKKNLYVGYAGSDNWLSILDGARVTSGDSTFLGFQTGSDRNQIEIDGNGSQLNVTDNLQVGYNGSANQVWISAGGKITSNHGYIGQKSGANGNSVWLTGNGSSWTNRGNLYVGASGNVNTLSINDGAKVYSKNGTIGSYSSASNNTVTVNGIDSAWILRGDLQLGNYGANNQMAITNHARVQVGGHATLGNKAIATGNRLLINNASFDSQDLTIGEKGSNNHLVLENGATVTTTGEALLGNRTGANYNQASIVGTETKWTIQNNLLIGNEGSNNHLNISEGAQLSNYIGYVGRRTSSINNKAFLSGAGTRWNNQSHLYVGHSGQNNQLFIADQAQVEIGDKAIIGNLSSATGNSVQINNASLIAKNLTIGHSGANNRLTLENGGFAALYDPIGQIILGHYTTATGNILEVTTGARITTPGDMIIGRAGANNQLQILSGGTVENTTAYMGYRADSDGNIVQIDGADSQWINEAALYIGYHSSSTGNLVRISNGGSLLAGALSIRSGSGLKMNGGNAMISGGTSGNLAGGGNFIIGDNSGNSMLAIHNGGRVASGLSILGFDVLANNNTATIDGANSEWTATDLTVGYHGSNNRMTLLNGGRIETDRVLVGAASGGSNNEVLISGAGSALVNANELIIGLNEELNNRWRVENHGHTTTRTATIANNGTLHLENGIFQTLEGLNINPGGRLSGWGQIDGDVANRGLILPGNNSQSGTLSFGDSLELNSPSELVFTLWDSASFDRIIVDDHLTFGGTLTVELGGGFAPQYGASFDLIDWNSASGTFDTTDLPTLSGSLSWDTSELYTTGTIRAVPEPAVATFIALGGAILIGAHRFSRINR